MPRGNYACRIDENQNEIVKTFRDLGASVLILSSVGKGCPDLLVGITDIQGRKHNILVEIKDGKKTASKRKLTKDEQHFFDTWKGKAIVIDSIAQAIMLYNFQHFPRDSYHLLSSETK